MKTKNILIILLFFLASALTAQEETDSAKIIKFSERIPPDLELEIKVTYTGAIGYADCFHAKVLQVNRGLFSDSTLLITVIAGDTANLNFISSGDENTVFKIFCLHNADSEIYSTAYITGFVDYQKTSWKIIAIHKK
jgi:hypothetical protein